MMDSNAPIRLSFSFKFVRSFRPGKAGWRFLRWAEAIRFAGGKTDVFFYVEAFGKWWA